MRSRHPRFFLRAAGAVALLLPLGVLASACLDPTQATIEITTNACSSVKSTGITSGHDDKVEVAPFGTTTDQCEGGKIGSLVLYPESEKDGPLVFKVVTSIGTTPVEECLPPFYA